MDDDAGQVVLCRCVLVCVCVLPVQLESQRAVDGGETEQSNPSQQDAAENTRLEIEDPDLQRGRKEPQMTKVVQTN